EWSIKQEFFNHLDNQWGPHKTDLFASPLNAKLPRFVTWRPHPAAPTCDSLRLQWTPLDGLYIRPPWSLLPHVLQKLQEEKLVVTHRTRHCGSKEEARPRNSLFQGVSRRNA
ncbi:hypothetical protein EDD21DRAFT_299130, partial [Dissophora ornata]